MAEQECPSGAVGRRCLYNCRTKLCVHYLDVTKQADTEEYGTCLLWTDIKGN